MSRSGWVVGIGLSGTVFFIGVYFGVSSIIEGQGTERTDGTVVRLQQQGSGSDVSYRPVVEYEVNGKTYQCTGKVGTNFDHIGDKVAVIYKIDRPEVGFVGTFSQRWGIPLVCCVFGGFFLGCLLDNLFFRRLPVSPP